MTICDSHIIRDCFKENMLFGILVLITNKCMSVRKSTSFYVLAWNSNTVSFLKKWSPGKFLHCCPIQRLLVFKALYPFFINPLDCGMNVEIPRPRRNIFEDFGQNIVRDSSIRTPFSGRFDFADLIIIYWEMIKLFMNDFLIIILIFGGEAWF